MLGQVRQNLQGEAGTRENSGISQRSAIPQPALLITLTAVASALRRLCRFRRVDGIRPSPRPHRIAGLHHVFKNLVHDVFLKDAEIPVAEQILFERFQLQTALARHVADGQNAEVGQAGLGADRGQLRIVDLNLVSGKLVLPGLDGGKAKSRPAFACSSVYLGSGDIPLFYEASGVSEARWVPGPFACFLSSTF
jgi:hypothetical protein